jgi:quercetin dioxygenase-like cupin family protein
MNVRSFMRTAAAALVLAALNGSAAMAAEAVKPAFNQQISNIPGKSIVAVTVDYAPGGKTPAHHHARSAFVTAYVLSGAIRSQVDDGPAQVFHVGESWSEKPGARHTVSENASATEPAKLLAIFVVDTNDTELTTIDKH